MPIAIDVSAASTGTPAYATPTLTSGAFTTAQANEIVVVLVAATDTDGGGGLNTVTIALAGAGLSWTRAIRKNTNGDQCADIWWALASSVLTAQTVTATVSRSGTGIQGTVYSVALHVLSFTGANTGSPIGATGSATNPNGTTANPSIALTTTAGSYCVAAGADYFTNATIAAGSGQTMTAKFQDSTNGEVEWTQRTTSTTTGTSQTMSATGLGSDGWVFVAAEIKAAAGADPFPAGYNLPGNRMNSALYRI